jgi:hypothetical protein
MYTNQLRRHCRRLPNQRCSVLYCIVSVCSLVLLDSSWMDPSASVLHNMARTRARRAGRLRANNLDAGDARAALCRGEN